MKKGISLIVLIITVTVLVILAGVVVVNTSGMFVNMELSKLQIDIAQLETLMNTYKIRHNGDIDFATVQFNLSSLSSEERLQFEGENVVDNKVSLYVVNLQEIDAEAINYGNLEQGINDRYLYSVTTGKVYYELGLKSDDIRYYYTKSGE